MPNVPWAAKPSLLKTTALKGLQTWMCTPGAHEDFSRECVPTCIILRKKLPDSSTSIWYSSLKMICLGILPVTMLLFFSLPGSFHNLPTLQNKVLSLTHFYFHYPRTKKLPRTALPPKKSKVLKSKVLTTLIKFSFKS